ncbi:MAG: DUF6067 family protein, partial [Fimbriimonas sp.]|nr:DUF6067 family protein [Fimbriimonas sp.]
SEFDRFAPMELPATATELERLSEQHPEPYWVFPEDRTRPVRTFDRIPALWAARGPSNVLVGEARPNEYYVYQLAVCPRTSDLKDVRIDFDDLVGPGGRRIAKNRLTCFNLGGTNWDGSPLHKVVNVAQGSVMPFWIGVDVPDRIAPGVYRGTVRIVPQNSSATTVQVSLSITGARLADRGDSELWRYARLRWLNSTLGTSNDPIPPYKGIEVKGAGVLGGDLVASNCSVRIGPNGLPSSIDVGDLPVLAGPIRLDASDSSDVGGIWTSFERQGAGRVTWSSSTESERLTKQVRGSLEFDGHFSFSVTLKAKKDVEIPDIGLVVPYAKESSGYFMGIGHRGGATPSHHEWDWKGPYDSWWLGGVQSGMRVELRGGSYHGPLLNLYHPAPPPAWFNKGLGRVRETLVDGAAEVRASTGAFRLAKGQEVRFEFALLVTPVKKIDTTWQFKTRFYHNAAEYRPTQTAIDAGANVVNVHHANDVNPYINYPFRSVAKMKAFVDEQHAAKRKVKIYDTIRELSNYTAEVWPLLALDGEVFVKGDGGGFSWLQEHVGRGYVPSWYHPYPQSGTADASMVTVGFSRWINYYVEGLNWLAKNVNIDGLYLDDVSYDRQVLKRMRRVLAAGGRAPMIDLHSNTGFSIGPANQYTEFFPYVDRLWFGESFDYDHMSPDQWLVETSGIPFGLMGEMLQGGGNRWLGMVYGMTTRFGWTNYETANNPDPIWRFWDRFGIAESKMIGYWEKDCPVTTDSPDVKATVYVRKDRVLIALGNFGSNPASCRLAVDWKRLGLDPAKCRMSTPQIANFQPERAFEPNAAIPIDPKRGWLIVVQKGGSR